ncbi:MAG: hypothetical protein M1838_004729 [Thelocarpon superellum]|nr:MAG: hypothetical protein M1838_004729 [Thelocarpon superellum]
MPAQTTSSGLPTDLCTLATCSLKDAFVEYQPSLAGNGFFLAIFIIAFFAQIGLGIRYRTWGYMAGMFGGLLLEIIGYIGRLKLHFDPFLKQNFLIYLVCLTLAPAFISAAIYLSLARIVVIYGEHISRVRPRVYTFLFIGCDLFSLVLQSIGGGIASVSGNQAQANRGIHIMAGGLAFQVASLVLFAVLCAEFAFRVRRHPTELDPTHAELRHSKQFLAFLYALALAVTCIIVRSVFRVAELSQGFDGQLANEEVTFMLLEGTMVIIATICLTVFHPGICFKGQWEEAYWSVRGTRKQRSGATSDDKEQGGVTPESE